MILFKNILIPIDGSDDAEVAVKKAVELYEPFKTRVHLVYIIKSRVRFSLFQSSSDQLHRKAEILLGALRKLISENDGCGVTSSVMEESNPTYSLGSHILKHEIDLMIICRKKRVGFFSFQVDEERIAKRTGCPALTITPGSLQHPVRSILLPVDSLLPQRKIQLALAFAKKYNAKIHLVIAMNPGSANGREYIDAFYIAYKMLKECGHTPQYKVLPGMDSLPSLLHYAEDVNAGMILLQPEKRSSITSLIHKKVSGLISPLSALQVLTLQPYI